MYEMEGDHILSNIYICLAYSCITIFPFLLMELWGFFYTRAEQQQQTFKKPTPTIFQSSHVVSKTRREQLEGLRQIFFVGPSCISFLVQRWEESLRVWGSETKPSFPRRRKCYAPTARG